MLVVNLVDGGYKVSGGLHGVGISVVNALSESMEVEVRRDGNIHKIRFERGNTVRPLKVIGKTEEQALKLHLNPMRKFLKRQFIVLIHLNSDCGNWLF